MTECVLLLTNSYVPHRIVAWEKAVTLIVTGKAESIEETDEVIYKKENYIIRMPSVIKLNRHISWNRHIVKFSRVNVFTRDDYRCAYCGSQKRLRDLNFDHVKPKHQGGKTTWENIVTSCFRCNQQKKNRTPEQAGMKLLYKPYRPKVHPIIESKLFGMSYFPSLWRPYVIGIIQN